MISLSQFRPALNSPFWPAPKVVHWIQHRAEEPPADESMPWLDHGDPEAEELASRDAAVSELWSALGGGAVSAYRVVAAAPPFKVGADHWVTHGPEHLLSLWNVRYLIHCDEVMRRWPPLEVKATSKPRGAPPQHDWLAIKRLAEGLAESFPEMGRNQLTDQVECEVRRKLYEGREGDAPKLSTVRGYLVRWQLPRHLHEDG